VLFYSLLLAPLIFWAKPIVHILLGAATAVRSRTAGSADLHVPRGIAPLVSLWPTISATLAAGSR